MATACGPTDQAMDAGQPAEAQLIAHRGASAYAPEHTLAAYELAIEQGADFIEPDLQITKDGRLVALHDVTLERTTNVRDVFPDRSRESAQGDRIVRRWHVADFTLEEVRRLDAGSWFGPEFSDERVPTFREVIELARGRAGIYPETKAPEVYADLGFEMERLLLAELARQGLDRRDADAATPVVIQSFSEASLRILRDELGSDLPLTFLLSGRGADEWTTDEGLARVKAFASGIGPAKAILVGDTTIVERAHAIGLTVTPWTFGAPRDGDYQAARDEMTHFVRVLGVDGLFTNNPDLFPLKGSCGG